ncbi:hypothetical protein [Deinococcus sp.]
MLTTSNVQLTGFNNGAAFAPSKTVFVHDDGKLSAPEKAGLFLQRQQGIG